MKIIKLLQLIDKKLIFKMYILIISMVFASFLEMLGISLILPFLSVLVDIKGSSIYLSYLNLIVNVDNKSQTEILLIVCFLIGIVYLFKNTFLTIINYIQLNYIKRFHQLLGSRLINIYLAKPLGYFIDKSSSLFLRNLSTELTMLSSSIINYTLLFLEGFVLIFIFLLLLIYDYKITLILFSTIAFFVIFYFSITQKKIKNWGKIRHSTEEKKIKTLKEALLFIREIRLYDLRDHFSNLFIKSNRSFSESMLKHQFVQTTVRYYLEFLAVLLILLLVFFIIFKNDINQLIPIIGLYVGSAFRILPSLNRIINAYQQIKFIRPILDNFSKDLIDEKIIDDPNIKKLTFKFETKIEFKKIEFSHKDSKKIFDDFNLQIKKGEFVVVVGDSGKGKSTFLDLLAGFQNPQKGEILIDDKIDIGKNTSEWYLNLSYSPQNNVIIDDSIKNNICLFGDTRIDEKKLRESLAISKLDEIVDHLPAGLDTNLGEYGNKFSGGQKQRIGIARTIYRDKPILLFDEATNALDKKTNIEIIKNLKKYGLEKNKTIIFITHNDDAEKYCDLKIDLNKLIN